jgi:uncharacterized protein
LPEIDLTADAEALYQRGLALISEKTRERNFEKAAVYFGKAAAQGHPGAQLNLGMLYENGNGLPQDFAMALHWYKQAEGKIAHAACRIADLYTTGRGVARDQAVAAEYYRVEAQLDCTCAQFKLGRLLEQKGKFAEALNMYRRAARAGDREAQLRLGILLSDGFSVDPQLVEACQWLTLAADAGEHSALLFLRQIQPGLSMEELEEARQRAKVIKDHLAHSGRHVTTGFPSTPQQ